jgi:hypothetical protein
MSTLTTFLKEQATRLAEPDIKPQLEQWIQSEHRLIQQLEEWLTEADSEKVLKIRREHLEIREERFGAYSAVRLQIDLGSHRVEIIPRGGAVGGVVKLENGEPAPVRGLIEMTNDDSERYRLYLLTDDRWYIKHHLAPKAVPLGKQSFESAMVDLLT